MKKKYPYTERGTKKYTEENDRLYAKRKRKEPSTKKTNFICFTKSKYIYNQR